jgi:8-oxo-dGTP pyrophosphatase MutT (NUDIX family)
MEERETNIENLLREFAEKLPRFPDGRIDYSQSDKAPVITCFVRFQNRILLLKRSNSVLTYKEKWNTVAGYLDEPKPIIEKALAEVSEELGIDRQEILQIKLGAPYEFFDPGAHKTWVVHPALAELKRRPEIRLDWEHTESKWILAEELKDFDTVPRLEESLKRVLV